MSKTISILGSTGSIGRQTLDVAEQMGLRVAAITARSSGKRVEEQVRKFHPALAVLTDQAAAKDLAVRLADTSTRVVGGPEGLFGGRRAAGGGHGGDRRGGHGRAEAHLGRHRPKKSVSPWPTRRPWCAPGSW